MSRNPFFNSQNSSYSASASHYPGSTSHIPANNDAPPELPTYEECSAQLPTYNFVNSQSGAVDVAISIPPSIPIQNTEYFVPPTYRKKELQHIYITTGSSGTNHRAFISAKSMRMFSDFGRVVKGHPGFVNAKNIQNQGEGLPLLVAQRETGQKHGDASFLRLYECRPSPEARDRLYDKVDDDEIGMVLKKKFYKYTRYRLQIRGVNIVVFAHAELPIVDFKIEDERFRFVRSYTKSNSDGFVYDLYLLTPDHISLADKVDSSLEVNPKNPLLRGLLYDMVSNGSSPSNRSKFASFNQCGRFENTSWEFSRLYKCARLSIYNEASDRPDANDSMQLKPLILVAVTLILQAHLKGHRPKLKMMMF